MPGTRGPKRARCGSSDFRMRRPCAKVIVFVKATSSAQDVIALGQSRPTRVLLDDNASAGACAAPLHVEERCSSAGGSTHMDEF